MTSLLQTVFALHLFVLQPAVAQSRSFTDTENTWAGDCIHDLAAKQVIQGYPDQTFRPNATVSRAEFATMLLQAFPNLPVPPTPGAVPRFEDISGHWAGSIVIAVAGRNLMAGYPDGTFRPNAPIRRAEVVVALMRAQPASTARPTEEVLSRALYDWGAVPQYARIPLAATIIHNRLVNYPLPNFFRPEAMASRAEVAALICQARSGSDAQLSGVPAEYITQMSDVPMPLPGGINLARIFYNLRLAGYPQDATRLGVASADSIALSENGQTLAIAGTTQGSNNPQFTVVNVNTGVIEWTQALSGEGTFPVALRNNQVIVGTDRGIEVWDIASRQRKSTLDIIPRGPGSMALSPDGRYLIVGSGNEVSVWDRQRNQRLQQVRISQGNPAMSGVIRLAIATPQPGDIRVVATNDREIWIWNAANGQTTGGTWTPQVIAPQFSDPIRAIALSQHGRWLTVASFNGGTELWDLSHQQLTVVICSVPVARGRLRSGLYLNRCQTKPTNATPNPRQPPQASEPGVAFERGRSGDGNDGLPNAAPLQFGLQRGVLGAVMLNFKSVTTRRINGMRRSPGTPLWQRNYYEHIIRDDASLQSIRQYIHNNPLAWQQDQLHPNNPSM
jgi:hypothetical protein